MIINFPSYAERCLSTIEDHGFEAWFVGGCVRDSIIERKYFDIDIATNALPDQIEEMFDKTIPTGKKHGTITVIIDSNPIEVTTYRTDSCYSDNRHPESVIFESNIESDLKRRDFTINALAYHNERGLCDLFGGVNDLKNGTIRAVGDPQQRFTEDALRILRAYRFASVLDFRIDKPTFNATFSCGELLSALSGERILSEFKKLSNGKNPLVIKDFINCGYLKLFGISEFVNEINNLSLVNNKYKAPAILSLSDHNADLIKSKLKADNHLIEDINIMDQIKSLPAPTNKTDLKILLNKLGEKQVELYTEFSKLIYTDEESSKISSFVREIYDNSEPFCINHLKINGNDLLKLGISGINIKSMLTKLTLAVIEHPELNTRSALTSLINKIM